MSIENAQRLVDELEACKAQLGRANDNVVTIEERVVCIEKMFSCELVFGMSGEEEIRLRAEYLKLKTIGDLAANRYKAAEREVHAAIEKLAEEEVARELDDPVAADTLGLIGMFDEHVANATLRLEECRAAITVAFRYAARLYKRIPKFQRM